LSERHRPFSAAKIPLQINAIQSLVLHEPA